MSPVPASAITIADGEITLNAELLAPKLGLSANADCQQRLNIDTVFDKQRFNTDTPEFLSLHPKGIVERGRSPTVTMPSGRWFNYLLPSRRYAPCLLVVDA